MNTLILKKHIEESEKHFRQLADFMPLKVWTADSEGNKNYFNQKWFDYTGISFKDLKNQGWKKIIHPDDWEKTKTKWAESIVSGNDYEMETRLLKKDGKYILHLSRVIALKDHVGKIKTWIGSNTEIPEQAEQKQELERAVLLRTLEIQQITKRLGLEIIEKEQQTAELILVNKALESFAHTSSHDLQEPLRKIQTFSGRILESDKQNLSDKGLTYFHIIQDAANRMQKLIEDLFTLNQLTGAERKFEVTNLRVLIDKVKAEFKTIIDEKHATVMASKLCPVYTIPIQFYQLMQNLISNALKFSKPDHPTQIIISSKIINGTTSKHKNLSPENKYYHITVTDNGIGFEDQYNIKVFEAFQRLHGKETYSGTGLGLAIVKKIVDNHHGIITATSKLNKGTTFNMYFPFPT
jgi:two-component system, chemotaxis family, CheB/CheR fusion protein